MSPAPPPGRASSRLALIAAAAIFLFAVHAPGLVCAQSCPLVPVKTLSTSCPSGACPAGQFCLGSGNATCRCLKVLSGSDVNLMISYDGVVSDEMLVNAWATNADLTAIDQWTLPTDAKNVISGGNTLKYISPGQTASVAIASNFLSSTSVTLLYITNLNLRGSIDALVTGLPAGLTDIAISNSQLMAFPAGLGNLKSLVKIAAVYNGITEIPASLTSSSALSTIVALLLQFNKISSFAAHFPSLVTLNLNGNALTAFPSVIFKHSKLADLAIAQNPMMDVEFTSEQAGFLTGLQKLELDQSSMRSSCATSQKVLVKGYTLCIVGAVDTDVITKKTKESTTATTTMTPSTSSTPSASSTPSTSSTPSASSTPSTPSSNPGAPSIPIGSATTSSNSSDGISTSSTNPVALVPTPIAGAPLTGNTPAASGSGKMDGVTNNTGTAAKTSSSTLPIIIGSAGGGLVLVLVVLVYLCKCKRNGKQPSESTGANYTAGASTMSANMPAPATPQTLSLWNDAELLSLKVSVDDIRDVKKIGSGAFADVWLVQFRNSETLASKRLRESDRAQTQTFIDEIKLVAGLKHPGIVAFMGVAWVRETDLQALFEYMDNGDLRSYLTTPRVPLQWSTDKLQFAIDVAEALVYVHSFLPPLVHRDLKSRNVLLNTDMRAKLTDFGVSRYRSEQGTMTAGVGTARWLAPEVIAGDGNYGSAADLFSFGVLLSELDSHEIPYDGERNAMGTRLADVALLQLVASGKLKPQMSSRCPEAVAEVANRCLALNPAQRPTAAEVAYALRTFHKTVTTFYV